MSLDDKEDCLFFKNQARSRKSIEYLHCVNLYSQFLTNKVDTRTTREIQGISQHKCVIRNSEQQRMSRHLNKKPSHGLKHYCYYLQKS